LSSDLRSWRDALILLLSASLATLAVQVIYGPILNPPFIIFSIYLPTIAAVIIYLVLRWRGRMKGGGEYPFQ